MSDLKPCPFCGSDSIVRHTRYDGSESYTECQCSDCGALGPDDCEGLNWNTRAAPPAPTPCPHIRSSGTGEHATNWCALNGTPQDAREAMRAALEALEGVVRVADRATVEFDAAREAIALLRAALGE